MTRPLPFVEAFGPTIQGEGPAMGRLADFVRFGGCNLSCSWCDSAYTWDASRHNLREQITMLDTQAVMDATPATAPLLVITGGEPLLNQNNQAFIDYVQEQWFIRRTIHVETNGTIAPNDPIGHNIDMFVVSPKLAHAGLHKRTQSTAVAPGWREYIDDGKVRLKVVVQTAADVDAAVRLADTLGMERDHVWVMPEGTTPAVLAERWPITANAAIAHGINASHRLHVLAWNDERGH